MNLISKEKFVKCHWNLSKKVLGRKPPSAYHLRQTAEKKFAHVGHVINIEIQIKK